jgi:hypothetical protein
MNNQSKRFTVTLKNGTSFTHSSNMLTASPPKAMEEEVWAEILLMGLEVESVRYEG